MVQHGDAQQLASALETSGDIAVIGAGGEVPAGVVVGDDDGGGAFTQGVGEDLDVVRCARICLAEIRWWRA